MTFFFSTFSSQMVMPRACARSRRASTAAACALILLPQRGFKGPVRLVVYGACLRVHDLATDRASNVIFCYLTHRLETPVIRVWLVWLVLLPCKVVMTRGFE